MQVQKGYSRAAFTIAFITSGATGLVGCQNRSDDTAEIRTATPSGNTAKSIAPGERNPNVHGGPADENNFVSPNPRIDGWVLKPLSKKNMSGTTRIIGDEDRQAVSVPVGKKNYPFPYPRLCRLKASFPFGDETLGTGVLIGPKKVLTAGHVIWVKDYGGMAEKVNVMPDFHGDSSDPRLGQDEVGSQNLYVPEALKSDDIDPEKEFSPHDIGVIVLSKDLGTGAGTMSVAAYEKSKTENVTAFLAGYPYVKPKTPGGQVMKGALFQHQGKVTVESAQKLSYKMDSSEGQSGAPVYDVDAIGQKATVFGVHTFGVTDVGNYAVRLTSANVNWINGQH